MGVILQVAYRQRDDLSVPAPVDPETSEAPWFADHIAAQCRSFAEAGFDAILTFPPLKAQGGSGKGCDGYGIEGQYDLGRGSPTRFGSKDQLQRMVAVAQANGLAVYADVILHHVMGGVDGTYTYRGSNGPGRFPKHPSCFCNSDPMTGKPLPGRVRRDNVADPASDALYQFGDEFSYVHSQPPNYVLTGMVDALDWLTRTCNFDGYRLDDVKGQVPQVLRAILQSKSMRGKFAAGEYSDGNPGTLKWWVGQTGERCSAFDFALHYTLAAMCNNASDFDMAQLDHAGLAGVDPMKAVTFLESQDSDISGSVIWNKMLGYAALLTMEGYPCVFYRDYSTDRGCYGLKPLIDNLIWIHNRFAEGETIFRWKEFQFAVYERVGNLLVGLNNDSWGNWKTVTVQTSFGPNVRLHDYTGNNALDCWTDEQGRVTFGIPPNVNGMGYVCWARAGENRANTTGKRRTTQTLFAAGDLDIDPASAGAGKIWAEKGTQIEVSAPAGVAVSFTGPGGTAIDRTVSTSGWHEVNFRSPGARACALKLTYQAPQTIWEDQ